MTKWVPTYFQIERSEALCPREDYQLSLKCYLDSGDRIATNGTMSILDGREATLVLSQSFELYAHLGSVALGPVKMKEYHFYEILLGYDKKVSEVYLRVRGVEPDKLYEDYRNGAIDKHPWEERRVRASLQAIQASPINTIYHPDILEGIFISTPQLNPGSERKASGFNGVLVELKIQN